MKLLTLLLLLCASAVTHGAGGIIVIGDSMSAQKDSWPTHLRESTGRNVMVMAQNGRSIRDFTLPNDLQADQNIDTVIYLLGGNDIMGKTPEKILGQRAASHLRFLKDRGFRVIVVLVPPFAFYQPEVASVNRILAFIAFCFQIELVDLAPVWDTGQTSDTVHPYESLSRVLAQAIEEQL